MRFSGPYRFFIIVGYPFFTLLSYSLLQISPRTSKALELERERSQSFNDTQASNKSNNNFNNTEFSNYAISTRDYTLPGSKDEQLEIGSAFLKVYVFYILCLSRINCLSSKSSLSQPLI